MPSQEVTSAMKRRAGSANPDDELFKYYLQDATRNETLR
jgi:hypothetical protein